MRTFLILLLVVGGIGLIAGSNSSPKSMPASQSLQTPAERHDTRLSAALAKLEGMSPEERASRTARAGVHLKEEGREEPTGTELAGMAAEELAESGE